MSFILTFIIEGCSISHFPGGKFLCGHLMEFFNLIYFNFLMLELLPFESLNVKFLTFFFPQNFSTFLFSFFKVGRWGGFPLKPSIQKPKQTYTHKHVCLCKCLLLVYLRLYEACSIQIYFLISYFKY